MHKARLIVGLAIATAASGCVSTKRPLPDFSSLGSWASRRKTTVQVFDPSGAAASKPIVVGKSPARVGRLVRSPWARVVDASAEKQGAAAGQGGAANRGAVRPGGKPGDAKGAAGKSAAGPQGADKQGADKKAAAPQGAKSGDGAASSGAAAEGAGADRTADTQDEQINATDLYELFGPRIVIHGNGTLTKAYFVETDASNMLRSVLAVPQGAGKKQPAAGQATRFVLKRGDSGAATILDTLMGKNEVTIDIINAFDNPQEYPLGDKKFSGAFPKVAAGGSRSTSDLILVTGKPEGISAFEQAMDLFYRAVPQILIDAKVVEVSYSDTLDIGVAALGSDPTVKTRGKGSFVQSIVSRFPNASAGTNSSEGVIALGGIHDNLELNVALEMLQTMAKSDIVSNPRIAVRNGGTAVIDTRTRLPYPEARISGQNVTTNIKFLDVGVSMQIRPDVMPGDTVRLQVFAAVDAISGFADTSPIPTPEISSRVARTTVHVPNTKTTVIGGLITKNRFEIESQLPVLGDIPVLGWLFRSTNIQESRNEVIFLITPRIIYGFQGSDPDEDFPGGGF